MANNFTTTQASGEEEAATLESQIETLVVSPKKTVTDEGSVEERSIDDLIKADQYLKAQNVTDEPLHGLRISRFVTAGPV